MVSSNTYYGIDKYTADLIRHKSHQLIGKAGFVQADRADIEQELMLDLLRRMKHFDPAKAKRSTFMSRIVEHRISTMLEYRFAGCRDWRKCRESLNEPIRQGEEGFAEKIENVTSPTDFRWDSSPSEIDHQHGRCIDLRRVLEALPEEMRDICERLKSQGVTEVARDLKIPRTTLYGKLLKIRGIFQAAQIHEYLGDTFVPPPVSKQGTQSIKGE